MDGEVMVLAQTEPQIGEMETTEGETVVDGGFVLVGHQQQSNASLLSDMSVRLKEFRKVFELISRYAGPSLRQLHISNPPPNSLILSNFARNERIYQNSHSTWRITVAHPTATTTSMLLTNSANH
jgi:hypothetical protein